MCLIDTGLAGHLLGLDEERLAVEPGLRGAFLETFVATELTKQASWSRRRPRLFHFRQTAGQEVDLVLEELSGAVVGVEVKASATVTAEDFKGLRAFAEIAGPRFRRGIVLYTGKTPASFGANLLALPVSSIWAPCPKAAG